MPVVNKSEIGINLSYNINQNSMLVLKDKIIHETENYRLVQAVFFQSDVGINDNLSVSFILPYLFQTEQVGLGDNTSTIRNNSIGDILVGSNYKFKSGHHSFNFGFAIKAPTGKNNSVDTKTNIPYPLSFQNGTGSWDVLFNLFDEISFEHLDNVYWINQLSARLNSKGNDFEAHPGYKFGNSFSYYSAVSLRWIAGNHPAAGFLGFTYQYIAQDQFDGGYANSNTGGNWIYTSFSYNHQFSPRFNIGLSLSVPIYRSVYGLQLTTRWQANTTLSYTI
ncbi:MAG: hypothetical protein MI975_16455 [Cytophagales bacterium]|nr:hypothetical protein [Cytophagales bacterium]